LRLRLRLRKTNIDFTKTGFPIEAFGNDRKEVKVEIEKNQY